MSAVALHRSVHDEWYCCLLPLGGSLKNKQSKITLMQAIIVNVGDVGGDPFT